MSPHLSCRPTPHSKPLPLYIPHLHSFYNIHFPLLSIPLIHHSYLPIHQVSLSVLSLYSFSTWTFPTHRYNTARLFPYHPFHPKQTATPLNFRLFTPSLPATDKHILIFYTPGGLVSYLTTSVYTSLLSDISTLFPHPHITFPLPAALPCIINFKQSKNYFLPANLVQGAPLQGFWGRMPLHKVKVYSAKILPTFSECCVIYTETLCPPSDLLQYSWHKI